MTFKTLILVGAALTLAACGNNNADVKDAASDMADKAKAEMSMKENSAKLATILDAQSDKAKARFEARNPQATLEFFGITPGMTVVDVLPGGGWYSKILIPYLGDDGHMIGVDYSLDMWPEFGGFADAEFIEKKKTWATEWVEGAQAWRAGSEGQISAFTFGGRDTAMDGKADAALFIRAMHNLSRFEEKGGYMTQALADTHALLKPGGIVGVVQHEGPEENTDEWAIGSNGYLKKSKVIAAFEAAGFELIKDSDINENLKDVPSNEDIVWRLPPSMSTSREDAELRAKMQEIGESNRMTLLFKKV
jgi:predicted methyltransferase